MYAPTNTVINTIMRWPALAAVIPTVAAVASTGLAQTAAAAVAGAVVGAVGVAKLFNDQICDCEEKGYTKLDGPKVEWIVEYDPNSGKDRPWDVYSMFAGLEHTKQHYASYSTEEHAKSKIEILKDLAEKVTKKKDED